MRRLCETRPADWWDTADGGARLALYLCRVCPALARCESGPEYGVIRAGKAYGDNGKVLPICPCGYPNRHVAGGAGKTNPLCHRCAVPTMRRWNRKAYWREWKRNKRQKARAA